jgi:hypothetical protein
LFLIQSTHHQLPRHQAASPHSLRFMRYTTPSTSIWAVVRQWVNGQKIGFEEWFVWREYYFSHRQTTFTAWLLVDSRSSHPHTHPLPPPGSPQKSGESEGVLTPHWRGGLYEDSESPMGIEGARYGQLEVSKPLGAARLNKRGAMPTGCWLGFLMFALGRTERTTLR